MLRTGWATHCAGTMLKDMMPLNCFLSHFQSSEWHMETSTAVLIRARSISFQTRNGIILCSFVSQQSWQALEWAARHYTMLQGFSLTRFSLELLLENTIKSHNFKFQQNCRETRNKSIVDILSKVQQESGNMDFATESIKLKTPSQVLVINTVPKVVHVHHHNNPYNCPVK